MVNLPHAQMNPATGCKSKGEKDKYIPGQYDTCHGSQKIEARWLISPASPPDLGKFTLEGELFRLTLNSGSPGCFWLLLAAIGCAWLLPTACGCPWLLLWLLCCCWCCCLCCCCSYYSCCFNKCILLFCLWSHAGVIEPLRLLLTICCRSFAISI